MMKSKEMKFEDEVDYVYMDKNIFLIMTDDFVAFLWIRSDEIGPFCVRVKVMAKNLR